MSTKAAGHLRAGSERQSHKSRVPVSRRSCGPAIDPEADTRSAELAAPKPTVEPAQNCAHPVPASNTKYACAPPTRLSEVVTSATPHRKNASPRIGRRRAGCRLRQGRVVAGSCALSGASLHRPPSRPPAAPTPTAVPVPGLERSCESVGCRSARPAGGLRGRAAPVS